MGRGLFVLVSPKKEGGGMSSFSGATADFKSNVETFVASVKMVTKRLEDLSRRSGSLRRMRGRKLRRFVRVMLTIRAGRNGAVTDTFPHLAELDDRWPLRVVNKRKYRSAWMHGYRRCVERVNRVPSRVLLSLIDRARENQYDLEKCARSLSLVFLAQDIALNESRSEDA